MKRIHAFTSVFERHDTIICRENKESWKLRLEELSRKIGYERTMKKGIFRWSTFLTIIVFDSSSFINVSEEKS